LSSSRDEQGRPKTPNGAPAGGRVAVKPREASQRAEPSPARDEGGSSVEGGSVATTNCAVLDEPPDADPHVRWCERGRLVAAPYSILQEIFIADCE